MIFVDTGLFMMKNCGKEKKFYIIALMWKLRDTQDARDLVRRELMLNIFWKSHDS
jgi:hypothetical protein